MAVGKILFTDEELECEVTFDLVWFDLKPEFRAAVVISARFDLNLSFLKVGE